MKELIKSEKEIASLRRLMDSALKNRFKSVDNHCGANANAASSHREEFGQTIVKGERFIFPHNKKGEKDLAAFFAALPDNPQKADIMAEIRKASARTFTETFLDTFNPEDMFEDAKFINRVAKLYCDEDYIGAQSAAENWLEIENGPASPSAKREAMDEAIKYYSEQANVMLRLDENGLFMDVLAGGESNHSFSRDSEGNFVPPEKGRWFLADGVVSKDMGVDEAKDAIRELGGLKKPAKKMKPQG